MHFTLVTLGLAAATLIASSNALEGGVSSKGLSNSIYSGIGLSGISSTSTDQYHPDTPGTNDGAVKQSGRGARDIIDGALDSTAGLAGRILDPGNGKNSISTGEGPNGIKGGAFFSGISGPISSFDVVGNYHPHGIVDFTAGIDGNGPGVGTGKSPTKRLFIKRNHGSKYDRAHIRRSRSSLPQRNQGCVVYKRRSRIDGAKKVELTRRF